MSEIKDKPQVDPGQNALGGNGDIAMSVNSDEKRKEKDKKEHHGGYMVRYLRVVRIDSKTRLTHFA